MQQSASCCSNKVTAFYYVWSSARVTFSWPIASERVCALIAARSRAARLWPPARGVFYCCGESNWKALCGVFVLTQALNPHLLPFCSIRASVSGMLISKTYSRVIFFSLLLIQLTLLQDIVNCKLNVPFQMLFFFNYKINFKHIALLCR